MERSGLGVVSSGSLDSQRAQFEKLCQYSSISFFIRSYRLDVSPSLIVLVVSKLNVKSKCVIMYCPFRIQ